MSESTCIVWCRDPWCFLLSIAQGSRGCWPPPPNGNFDLMRQKCAVMIRKKSLRCLLKESKIMSKHDLQSLWRYCQWGTLSGDTANLSESLNAFKWNLEVQRNKTGKEPTVLGIRFNLFFQGLNSKKLSTALGHLHTLLGQVLGYFLVN